jgi:hypothetical protein
MQCICKKEIDTNGEFNFDINKIYDFEIVNKQYLISDGNDNYRLTMNHDDFLDNFIFVLQQKPEDAYTTAILSGWTGKEVLYASKMNDVWNGVEKRYEQ